MSKYHENTGTYLSKAVCEYEKRTLLRFQPTSEFYEKLDINRIRFVKILEGKIDMRASEANRLANYFGMTLEKFLGVES